jgi:hypothetical protein
MLPSTFLRKGGYMPNVSTKTKLFLNRILKCNFKVGANAWYKSFVWYLLHAFLDLLCDPEDGRNMFL